MLQQDQSFMQAFQRAIKERNIIKLQRLYDKFPIVRNMRTSNDMTPIDYVLSKYGEKTPSDLEQEIIKMVINHSSHEDLNEADSENDTILSRVYNYNDDIIYSLITMLVRKGYNFNRTDNPVNDFALYMAVCYQDKRPIDKRIVRLMFRETEIEIFNHYMWQCILTAVKLSYSDMDYILTKLEEKHVQFPTYIDETVMNNLIEFSRGSEHIRKLDRLLQTGMNLRTDNVLTTTCKHPISLGILHHLLELLGPRVEKRDLDKALLEYVVQNVRGIIVKEKVNIIKELCEHGADTTYNENGRDAFEVSIRSKNHPLIRALLPYTDTNVLKKTYQNRYLDSQVKKIIQEDLHFRNTMTNVKRSLAGQQRRQSLRSVRERSLPPQEEFITALPSELRHQLQSMVYPRHLTRK